MATSHRITLYASQLAAAAGFNKYESPESVLEKCGIKPPSSHVYDSITNKELIDLAKSAKLDIEKLTNLEGQPPLKRRRNVEKVLSKICKKAVDSSSISESSKGETLAIEALSSACKERFTTKQIKQLKKEVNGLVSKQKGCKMEKDHTDLFSKQIKRRVEERNNRVYTLDLEIDDYVLHVRGKVDGIMVDPKTKEQILVETKTRRYRLFNSIPVYEKIQMEIYMRMLGINKAVLNQCLSTSSKSSTFSYTKDDVLWKEVLAGLCLFVSKAKAFN